MSGKWSDTTHRFKVGQTVSINPSMFDRHTPRDAFKVVRLMPNEGGMLFYRVKSLRDNHERVVSEVQIA